MLHLPPPPPRITPPTSIDAQQVAALPLPDEVLHIRPDACCNADSATHLGTRSERRSDMLPSLHCCEADGLRGKLKAPSVVYLEMTTRYAMICRFRSRRSAPSTCSRPSSRLTLMTTRSRTTKPRSPLPGRLVRRTPAEEQTASRLQPPALSDPLSQVRQSQRQQSRGWILTLLRVGK